MDMMQLPEPIQHATRPVFEALPFNEAMTHLVVEQPLGRQFTDLVAQAVETEAIQGNPALAAGLWLYVDELERSHKISQGIDRPTGSFWHGIMHRREGDFSNSHHWFRQAGNHPAMVAIEPTGEACAGDPDKAGTYDPHQFVDLVEQAHRDDDVNQLHLIELQRREWAALFAWCAEHPGE